MELFLSILTVWSVLCDFLYAKDCYFSFEVSYTNLTVAGNTERQVIWVNEMWPLPIIRVDKGDRVLVNLTNFIDEPVSIHFHGIFQTGTNNMDGADMLTQCGVPTGESFLYNFTVDQVGTYWYHSHSNGQYGDGLRGVMVVDDPDVPFAYDYDIPLSVSDWYYLTAREQMEQPRFLRGSEPVVDVCLFNETDTGVWDVEPDKTYYLRIVNVGMSLPQYLYLEDHNMTIVEIDGVYVEPVEVDSIYLTSGQRYGVLIHTKSDPKKNFRFVQILQKMMSTITNENWLRYDKSIELISDREILDRKQLNYIDDFDLVPLEKTPVLEKVDKKIELSYQFENSGYSFNHVPYHSPEIPTLYTVISASNASILEDKTVYGAATNPQIISKGEIVEITVNSHDMMKHPFHLHGHNFQVIYRGKDPSNMVIPEHPMIRDTINLEGHSQVVLRFKADNPGIWIFHCHVDWHLIQGLAVTFIEDPVAIRDSISVGSNQLNSCRKRGISINGKGSDPANGGHIDSDLDSTGVSNSGSTRETIVRAGYIALAILVMICIITLFVLHFKRWRAAVYQKIEQSDIELDEI